MNQTRNKNQENNKNQSILTKETLGVVLILFATLSLVCLITRDAVFSAPGKYVNAFLHGCFGVFAYAVVIFMILEGVLLVSDKTTGLSLKKKTLVTLCFALIAVLSHVISMRSFTLSAERVTYGQYLSQSYLKAEGGIATCSAGGLITALVAYPLAALLSNVGCYVVIGIALSASIYFTVVDFLKIDGEKVQTASRFRGAFVKKEQENKLPNGVTIEGVKDYPVDTQDFTQNSEEKQQKLFVNNPQDFTFRTKREIAKDKGDTPVKFGFADHGLGVAGAVNPTADVQSKIPTYSDDFKNKLDYIKTPVAINVENIGSKTYSSYTPQNSYSANEQTQSTTVSDYVNSSVPISSFEEPKSTEEQMPAEEGQAVIPHHEHKEEPVLNDDSAESHAMAFGSRYVDLPEINQTVETEPEAEEVFRPMPSDSQVDDVTDVEQTPTVSHSRNFDIPMIEENTEEEQTEKSVDFTARREDPTIDDIDFTSREEKVERFEEIETSEEEKPADSVIGSSRVRGIFFGEEQKEEKEKTARSEVNGMDGLGFTSRAAADDNLGSRGSISTGFGVGFGASIRQPVEKKEEPKEIEKPPKVLPPINRKYFSPPLDLLETREQPLDAGKENHEERMQIIKQTLEDFHINAEPKSYVQGPSITRYEIMMPAGISVKKVLNYDDDLKMRLAAKDGVRIEAPIPGKNLVGIEVANSVKVMVGLKEVMEGLASKKTKDGALMFALGKDIVGNAISDDLTKGPHYLIAGATGSGKSVALHVMIVSLLMRYSPEELKLVLVDPKSVEFRKYEHIPHLLIDEIITEPKRALVLLQWAYDETNRRNEMFTECGSEISNINDYNSMIANDTIPKLPRIVFVIDELADLMESCKKDLEEKIRKIAAKSRSAGIHLVLATQRPSVDVITGTIKANLPSRIALKVMTFADSQTILSEAGAEKLLGNGDMLYKNSSMGENERYQGAYISGREVTNIVNYIKENNKAYFDDDIMNFLDKETKPKQEETSASDDGESGGENEVSELFLQALWLAINSQTASISQFQRRFSIGYARAGGLIDKMERMGFVSPNEGSKARRVLITKEEYENRFGPAPEAY